MQSVRQSIPGRPQRQSTYLRLHPIVSPVPELIILEWSSYHRTIKHMRWDWRVIPDITDIVPARCRCRVWVLGRVGVHTDHIDRFKISPSFLSFEVWLTVHWVITHHIVYLTLREGLDYQFAVCGRTGKSLRHSYLPLIGLKPSVRNVAATKQLQSPGSGRQARNHRYSIVDRLESQPYSVSFTIITTYLG